MRMSLSSLFISASLVVADLSCKCLYGDECWPSASEWSEFAETLASPDALIIDQRPPGAVCHQQDPLYDEEACSTLVNNQDDPVYMSNLINGVNYLNFDSLINSTAILDCPYEPDSANATCYQGRVPPFAVNVTEVHEI